VLLRRLLLLLRVLRLRLRRLLLMWRHLCSSGSSCGVSGYSRTYEIHALKEAARHLQHLLLLLLLPPAACGGGAWT
jgi:hypothetical protein